ncbi:hemin uptake protein HemP [Mangrovicoccus ximenensis]|uniref:hemin uptake protein HemP n=1 Tax=Mangrovicoccus ximenensis TaxID=1911570 RepID=UPI000D3A2AA9|nr:hemin uptake protein HemP [Mangrovicoccus ximenensis]
MQDGGSTAESFGQTPRYEARDLVAEGTTALIHLDGQVYTLRITRMGKLILTK